jgi:hypothetical protein
MTDFAEIGAAVIGTGFIGTVHVQALRRLGVQVRGVLGSSPERGAARAAEIGVAHAYASLDDLLADDSVDVVHVTTPNHAHYEQVKAILAAGKNVVCEKPLAMTSEQSAEMVEIAKASGKGRRRLLQHPLLPAEPAGAWHGEGGGAWRYPFRHRPLPPGLAGQAHRLELAAGIRDGRRAQVRGRYRHALGGPDGLRHRAEAQAVMAELATFLPERQKAHRPGRDLLQRRGRDGEREDRHRRRRDDRDPLRGRRARRDEHQPDQRGPQELAAMGRGGVQGQRGLGQRDARSPVHRASRRRRTRC